MCGRFALGIPKKRLEEVFGLPVPDGYAPGYNAAPGTDVLAVSGAGFVLRRWGLVPSWADGPEAGRKLINARCETVFDKASFREGARTDRLLVPAQAFYEWKRGDTGRVPHAVAVRDADCFAMAAVGGVWTDPATGVRLETLAVLTCAANALMAPIHDRMPVILPTAAWAAWLDPGVDSPRILAPLLVPYPADGMRAWTVSGGVNSPANNGPDLLEPVRPPLSRQGSLL